MPAHARNAGERGHAKCIKLLIGAGCDSSARWCGNTCLMLASSSGKAAAVQAVLPSNGGYLQLEEHSEDVVGNGRTALHYAATTGKAEVVQALLEAGADMKAKDKDGATSFHVAAGAYICASPFAHARAHSCMNAHPPCPPPPPDGMYQTLY